MSTTNPKDDPLAELFSIAGQPSRQSVHDDLIAQYYGIENRGRVNGEHDIVFSADGGKRVLVINDKGISIPEGVTHDEAVKGVVEAVNMVLEQAEWVPASRARKIRREAAEKVAAAQTEVRRAQDLVRRLVHAMRDADAFAEALAPMQAQVAEEELLASAEGGLEVGEVLTLRGSFPKVGKVGPF